MLKRLTLCVGAAAVFAITPAIAYAGTTASAEMHHFSGSSLVHFDEPPGRSAHGNGYGSGTDKSDHGNHSGWNKGNHFGWGHHGNGSNGC